MFPITSEKEVFAKKTKLISTNLKKKTIYITSEKAQRRTEKKTLEVHIVPPWDQSGRQEGEKSWRRIECPSTNLLHKINFPIKKCFAFKLT